MASNNPYEGSVSSPSDQSFHSAREDRTLAGPALPSPSAGSPPPLPRTNVPERSAPPRLPSPPRTPPSPLTPPLAPRIPPLHRPRDSAEEYEIYERRDRGERFSPLLDYDEGNNDSVSSVRSRRYGPSSPLSDSLNDLRSERSPPSWNQRSTDRDSYSHRGGPYTEASIYYTDKDRTPRRRKFTMLPNGERRESDVPLRLEESDEDEFGVDIDAESYRPAQRLKQRPKPSLQSARSGRGGEEISDGDNGQSGAETERGDDTLAVPRGTSEQPTTETKRKKKGVAWSSDVVGGEPDPGDTNTKSGAEPAKKSDKLSSDDNLEGSASRQRSTGSSNRAPGERSPQKGGLEILPTITSSVRLPALTLGVGSGGVLLGALVLLIFLPELFPFRFVPLIIPGLLMLASLSARGHELEYMCLASIFFIDNGLLRAFVPHNTPLRAMSMFMMQAIGCSRWNGKLVIERGVRLWTR